MLFFKSYLHQEGRAPCKITDRLLNGGPVVKNKILILKPKERSYHIVQEKYEYNSCSTYPRV